MGESGTSGGGGNEPTSGGVHPWETNTRGHRHDPVAPVPWKTVDDKFFVWLQWSTPGHVMQGNWYCYDYVARNLPSNNPMVEIGTFAGLSTNQISHCKRVHGRRNPLYTCDRWLFQNSRPDLTIGRSGVRFAEMSAFLKETYVRGARFFNPADDLPRTVEMYSDEFFEAWGRGAEVVDVFGNVRRLGGPISFCFIDGNHDYEYVRRDFLNTDRFLEPGGFVLFDDSTEGAKDQYGRPFGVCQVVEEVKATGRYEVVVRNPNYLFVKK